MIYEVRTYTLRPGTVTEGQIHRLKLLKCQGDERASVTRIWQRVL